MPTADDVAGVATFVRTDVGLPLQLRSPLATPRSGIPARVTGVARLYAGSYSPRATLRGPALTSDEVWQAVVADALTFQPNQVVLDLTHAPEEVARPVRRALRTASPWPHAPVLVVLPPDSPIAPVLARVSPSLVDLVASLDVASSIVTARPWVPATSRTLRAPLISPAIARAEALGAAAAADMLPRVDAAMSVVGELVTRALEPAADLVQLRFAAAPATLGVCVAWNHGDTPPVPGELDDTVGLLAALGDVHGVHRLPQHSLAWAVLHRIPAELLAR